MKLLAGVALGFALSAHAEPFQLLCRSYPPDHPVSYVFAVDYDRSLVNGTRVDISPNAIMWRTVEFDAVMQRNVTFDHKIDRLTATYVRWGRGILYSGPGPVITCAKAPPPKF